MPDEVRHDNPDTPRPTAARFALTLRDVFARFDQAGMPRDMRTLQRYCASGLLTATKEMTATGMQYFIDPDSVDRAIKQLAQMHVLTDGARYSPASDNLSHHVGSEFARDHHADMPRPTAVEPDEHTFKSPIVESATEATPARQEPLAIPDTPRPTAADPDIFDHPYVKRLESEVEKWQGKYEAQVGRTQEVLQRANENLIELQQANAVANSQTLADFMLKAGRFLKAPFGRDDAETGTQSAEAEV